MQRKGLHDLGVGKDFWNKKQQALNAVKRDKLDVMKIKNFSSSKDVVEWKGKLPIRWRYLQYINPAILVSGVYFF